jgi:hypothetical protein
VLLQGIGRGNESFHLLLKRVESNTSFGDALVTGGKPDARPAFNSMKQNRKCFPADRIAGARNIVGWWWISVEI